MSNISGIITEFIDFATNLWNNIYKNENKNTDKHDIEPSNDDAYCRIFLCEKMSTISFSMESPLVYFLGKVGSEFKKNISKKESNKKKYNKVIEAISDEKKG